MERVTRAAADPLNLWIPAPCLEVRKNFFSQRVPESWNKIPVAQALKQATTARHFAMHTINTGKLKLLPVGDQMFSRQVDAVS